VSWLYSRCRGRQRSSSPVKVPRFKSLWIAVWNEKSDHRVSASMNWHTAESFDVSVGMQAPRDDHVKRSRKKTKSSQRVLGSKWCFLCEVRRQSDYRGHEPREIRHWATPTSTQRKERAWEVRVSTSPYELGFREGFLPRGRLRRAIVQTVGVD
jgi:hypothetical protein